ncbi:hypothetical protein GCM10011401_15880 [Nesterenkonia cremea]|uniref:Uncharacterized protein n=1 Tax=Nesterenkonia cremea TaxID=1882340 RepID=A0A917ARG4_9MICC|nr:hypothetical protein GCM10011401_15880 [Nesterenkonia cremea]
MDTFLDTGMTPLCTSADPWGDVTRQIRQRPRSLRRERGLCVRISGQEILEAHSETTLVTFGSTAMPGPKVVETVTLWM